METKSLSKRFRNRNDVVEETVSLPKGHISLSQRYPFKNDIPGIYRNDILIETTSSTTLSCSKRFSFSKRHLYHNIFIEVISLTKRHAYLNDTLKSQYTSLSEPCPYQNDIPIKTIYSFSKRQVRFNLHARGGERGLRRVGHERHAEPPLQKAHSGTRSDHEGERPDVQEKQPGR